MCVDREGIVDDLSEGFFACLSPHLRHDRSRTRRVEVTQPRHDKHKLTSLGDQRPRRGWSMPCIVENSDISYFILYAKTHLE
jgi:hypothetical protein